MVIIKSMYLINLYFWKYLISLKKVHSGSYCSVPIYDRR